MSNPTPTEAEKVVADLLRAVMKGEDGCGTLPAKESVKVRPQDWHRITRLAREAAALIESQRATIERVERDAAWATNAAQAAAIWTTRAQAAEARVTALEAERAGYRSALERIARWEKHGGEKPRVYPVDIARAALSSTEVKNDE